MKNIRVASVQFEHAPSDKKTNLAKIKSYVAEAAAQGVELIVFPECCITGYLFMRQLTAEQMEALAEPVPCFRRGKLVGVETGNGPSSQALMALATEHK